MPATDYQGSSVPFASIGRSILSIRRDQVHAMDGGGDASAGDQEIEAFQRHVADLFQDLGAGGDADVLSLSWVRRLLETFLICMEEFRVVLFNRRAAFASSPLACRLVSDFFERAVKALDVLNAVRDGAEQLRQWQRLLEIVALALDAKPGGDRKSPLGEGQLRRARKALVDAAISMLDEKDASASILANRNRSFGRAGGNSSSSSKDHHHRHGGGHFRSLSWSVSRSWSAARQLQAIGNNLAAPRSQEVVSTGGVAVAVFTMSSVLLFVMWALVAAIPCQDRGLQTHFSVVRGYLWAPPILALHDKILEESKKKDRKNSAGLLKEIYQIENCTRHLLELIDMSQFPLLEERESEVRQGALELNQICDVLKDGLEPMERQVREVFHRIVRSRTERLDCLGKSQNPG